MRLTSVILAMMIALPCGAIERLVLSDEARELVASVEDTTSMSWPERWRLSQELWGAAIREESSENALFLNRMALAVHQMNFDAHWKRMVRLHQAEHLRSAERSAALKVAVAEVQGIDPGDDRRLIPQRLRALVVGHQAIFELTGDSTSLQLARRIATDRLDEADACRNGDFIFIDFLGRTAASGHEAWRTYSDGHDRCADMKFKAEFYLRMVRIAQESPEVASPEEISDVLRDWLALVDRREAAMRDNAETKSHDGRLRLGLVAAEYLKATDAPIEERLRWLRVAGEALARRGHTSPWLRTQYHHLAAVTALERGDRSEALRHTKEGLVIVGPLREERVANDEKMARIVSELDSFQVILK